jgi:hypothetical protein
LTQREELGLSTEGYAKKTPIWRNAFSLNVLNRWTDLKYKGMNENIDVMTYYTALSCFINDGSANVELRRELLYWFLEAIGFDKIDVSSSINRNYAGLPSSNLYCKRVVKNLCTNYINSPEREYLNLANGEPIKDDKQLETLKKLTSGVGIDFKLLAIHRKAKFCGQALIHPRIRKNEVQLQILTPNEYQIEFDSYGNMLAVFVPFNEIIPNPVTGALSVELRYDYWDKTVYRLLDRKGNPIPFNHTIVKSNPLTNEFTDSTEITLTELKHGYGRIPYELLNFDINDGDGYSGEDDLWELLQSQLICNALDFMAMQNVSFSAISLWLFVNFQINPKTTISPGKAFVAEGVKEPDAGDLLPPSADTIAPQTYFDAINDLKEKVMIQTMKNLGLPNSLILDNPGLASGEAMKVDYRELEMIRREDVELLKPFEKRVLDTIIIVANKDAASPYLGKINYKYDYSIDYRELFSNEKTKEEIETLIQKKDLGVISPLELLTALNRDDNITTDEEAIEIMKKNKEYFKLLNEVNNDQAGTGSPTNQEGERADPNGGFGGKEQSNTGTNKGFTDTGSDAGKSNAGFNEEKSN